MHTLHPVILSGGSGSRLWPLSREAYPKQLLSLSSEKTMLQDTVLRAQSLQGEALTIAAPLIICNQEHRFLIREQCLAVGNTPAAIYLEPAGRNTAPAIALAALHLVHEFKQPDALMLVMPADHYIADITAFSTAVAQAAAAAAAGYLVTFGIRPTHAETGYGYIKAGSALAGLAGVAAVERFVEKPPYDRAVEFVDAGNYSWNSGMFLFTAARYLQELGKYRPAMLQAASAAWESRTHDLGFYRPEKQAFLRCEADSIDYAVMQTTTSAAVVQADMGWSDVGAWDSLWKLAVQDGNGNVASGDVLALDTRNSYLRAESRLLAVTGVDDLVVIETRDAVLVMPKQRAQDVKQIVESLKVANRSERLEHLRVHRPWGWYEQTDEGEGFKVKRLMVTPGEKLSLQLHHHRSEHWVVVAGVATVTVNDDVRELNVNESVYIPVGARHRLENRHAQPLHLIEVQSGSYLGEDDIVRFDDKYSRVDG